MWNRRVITFLAASGLGLLVFAAAPAVFAQNETHEHGAATPAAPQAGASTPTGRASMMADMQAQEKKLNDLVARMNAASGQAKVDRLAEVVTEMAAAHTRMHAMMMQSGMMSMMGRQGGAPEKAAPAGKTPDGGHDEHHKE